MQNNSMNLSDPVSPRVKILVVDDHSHTAELLAHALSQLGTWVDVVSATSGQQALGCAQDGAVDILIADMNMPEMTGLELIEKFQKHQSGGPAFSFLLTACHIPGLQIEARRLNVSEVLYKPVHPQRVCQFVRQALEEMERCKPRGERKQKNLFKILIADDDHDDVELLSRYLQSEGYTYITAKSGPETLEQIRTELPDLVLLDIDMPYKDGFTVLKEMRTNPATQHIPVIIVSAVWLDPPDIRYCRELGAEDYFTKPIERRELFSCIRTKLSEKETQDDSCPR
jgi:CheY-like chemotaxis protein